MPFDDSIPISNPFETVRAYLKDPKVVAFIKENEEFRNKIVNDMEGDIVKLKEMINDYELLKHQLMSLAL